MADEGDLRQGDIDVVLSHLRNGVNVSLVGMRASGRSTMLRAISQQLRATGRHVVAIRGVRALRDRPLAALAVAGVPISPAGRLHALASAVTALEGMVSTRPSVLVIDDADDLDRASIGAIVATTTREHVGVLTSARPVGRRAGEAGSAFAQMQTNVQFNVASLPFESVHLMVHRLLGGPVDPSTLARIFAASGGLPGLVEAMVTTARQARRLERHEGVWVASGRLWTTALAPYAAAFLADLDKRALEAITVLSVAGVVPMASAGRLIPAELLGSLEDAGLLRVVQLSGELHIGVFPPAVAEYLTHELSATRRLAAEEHLADIRLTEGSAHDGRAAPAAAMTMRGAPWSAEETSPAPEDMAVLSYRMFSHWRSVTAARWAAWQDNPIATTAAPLLESLLVTGAGPQEVDAVVTGTASKAPTGDPEERSTAVVAALQSLYALTADVGQGPASDRGTATGDGVWTPAARALLRVVAGPVVGTCLATAPAASSGPRDPGRGAGGPPATGPASATTTAVRAGAPPHEWAGFAAGPRLGTATAGLGLDGLQHEAQRASEAQELVAAGHAQAALALLEGFASSEPAVAHCIAVTRELAHLHLCDFDAALGEAMAGVRRGLVTLDPSAVQAHAYVAAVALLLQGRLAELDDLVSLVLASSPMPLQQSAYLAGLLLLAAASAMWQNRLEYPRTIAAQLEALRLPRGAYPLMIADCAGTFLRDTDDAAAADQLWALAMERLASGFGPAGIVAGVASIERRPDIDRAARLRAAAHGCDCPMAQHLCDYAVAIASGDTDRLYEVERQLRLAGIRLFAVRAAIARTVILLETGDITGAREQADAAWHHAGLHGQDLRGLFFRIDRAVALTAREREVARLVAQGNSSAQIAASMVLSVRTVEYHIFNACRKAGANTREELAHVARTWLGGDAP